MERCPSFGDWDDVSKECKVCSMLRSKDYEECKKLFLSCNRNFVFDGDSEDCLECGENTPLKSSKCREKMLMKKVKKEKKEKLTRINDLGIERKRGRRYMETIVDKLLKGGEHTFEEICEIAKREDPKRFSFSWAVKNRIKYRIEKMGWKVVTDDEGKIKAITT